MSLANSSVEIYSLKKESEALADRISFLSSEADLLREKLAADRAADISKEEAQQVQTTLALASHISFSRQESDAIRRQLAVAQKARHKLEQEAQAFKALYEPAQAELDAAQKHIAAAASIALPPCSRIR